MYLFGWASTTAKVATTLPGAHTGKHYIIMWNSYVIKNPMKKVTKNLNKQIFFFLQERIEKNQQ